MHPCQPMNPRSASDLASIRVPVVSNFGADSVTLILRRDFTLGSSAGEIGAWRYEGEWIVCELEPSGYPGQAPASFAVKKSDTLLAMMRRNEYQT
jgi:hypothetical protein